VTALVCDGRFLEVTYLSAGDTFMLNEESVTEYVVLETFREFEFGRLKVRVAGHDLPFAFMSDDDKVFVFYK
jgi:hypothetical protein